MRRSPASSTGAPSSWTSRTTIPEATLFRPPISILARWRARDAARPWGSIRVMGLTRLSPFIPGPGPVEVKIEFTPEGLERRILTPGEGVEKIDSRTWVFRGKDILEAWFKFGLSF